MSQGSKLRRLFHHLGQSCRQEHGASTIEWIGLTAAVLVLVGSIIGYIDATNGGPIGPAISTALERLVFSLEGGGGGAEGPGAPGGGSWQEEPGSIWDPLLGVASVVEKAVKAGASVVESIKGAWHALEDWWAEVRNREEKNFGDHVLGALIGVGEKLTELVGGVFTLAGDVVSAINPLDSRSAGDVVGKYVDGIKAFVEGLGDDPLRTLAALIIDPEDWEAGRYGQVFGQAIVEIAMLFLPDEAAKLSKIDKYTPDELVSLLNRIDKLTPEEAARVLKAADNLTPDEVARLVRRMDEITPETAAKLAEFLNTLDHLTPDEIAKALDAYKLLKNKGVKGVDDVFNNLLKSNENNYLGYLQELDEAAQMIRQGNTVLEMGNEIRVLESGRRLQVDLEFMTPDGIRVIQESKAGQKLVLDADLKDQLNRLAQYVDEFGEIDYAQLKFTGQTISKPTLEYASELGIRVYDSNGKLLNYEGLLEHGFAVETDMFGAPLPSSQRLVPSWGQWWVWAVTRSPVVRAVPVLGG